MTSGQINAAAIARDLAKVTRERDWAHTLTRRPHLRRRLAAYRYRRTIGFGRRNCLRYALTYDPS